MMIYIDGFDSYATTDLSKRWNELANVGGFTVGANGRNSGSSMRVTTSNLRQQGRTFGASKASVVVGFAVKFSALGAGGGSAFCWLMDGASNQIVLKVDGAGVLYLFSGTTSIASYAAGITAGVYYYIEIKVTISTSISANSCKIAVNGVTVITPAATTNLRQGSTNASVNILALGADATFTTSTTIDFDDVYMLDNSGSQNNDLLGDVRVEVIRPSAAGNSTQFTPDSGSNYARVNETSEDGDTSYVASSTVGNLDSYAMGDLASTPANVYGVQLAMVARKDDAGARIITGVVRSGGTTYDHGSTNTLGVSDGYSTLVDLWELDPNGSIAWTGTSVNAMEAGVKLVG